MHLHSADCNHHDYSCNQSLDAQLKQRQLTIALLLIGAFAVAELVVGFMSHSLALVAESGHMASDSLALGLALLATWITRSLGTRSSNSQLETGAALINSIALVLLAFWIGWEAIEHLQTPPTHIDSVPMLFTACLGAAVNGMNVALLHRGSDHDLNLKAAFLHVLADTVSSIGVVIAAISIATLNWLWADGAISLLVAGLIFASAVPLVIESVKAFLNPLFSLKSVQNLRH